ncbi:MAG TPA: tetratricopeptide repeat protein [Brumimicrobium sp.]|nr:tetratricopeptide repeat protein [Brumimicrobium sp.]
MRHYRTLLFLFLLSIFSSLNGQEDINDQLRAYEKASVDDKIKLFFTFFAKVGEIEKDTVLYYVKDLQNEGLKNSREDAVAMANFGMIPYLQENSLFEDASDKLHSVIKYYQKVENDTMLADVYNALGNNAFLQGEIEKAELFYYESTKFATRSGNEKFQMLSLFNIARVYTTQGKYDEAHSKLDEYIEFLKKDEGQIRMLAAAYGLLGQIYLNQSNHKKAIENFTRSMEFGLTVGSMKTVANGYTNLAIVEFFSENYDRSEQYFHLALAYRIKDNDKFYIAEGYYNLGDFYSGIDKMDSAIVNYEKSLEVGKDFNNLQAQKDALLQLSAVYEKMGDKAQQIQILKEIIKVQGEINLQKNTKELSALRMSHNQSFNEVLSVGGIREKELRSQINKYQSIFNNWIIFTVICVLGLASLFYFIRKKSKA